MPYMVQEPVDGYGQCKSWAQQAIAQHPDLMTYNSTGLPIDPSRPGFKAFVRVDSINFAKQIYADMVNIYNNINSVNPNATQYWYGVSISAVFADIGGYPKSADDVAGYMMSPATVINYANSPLCAVVTILSCSQLISLARGGPTNIPQIYTLLSSISARSGSNYGLFSNSELELALAYASYNFTRNYGINHPFGILPAYNYYKDPSQYPPPYNTPYIESLNLLQNMVIASSVNLENGNAPTASSVQWDVGACKSLSPYGNLGGMYQTLGNFFVKGGGTGFMSWTPRATRNMMYFEPACVGTSFLMPSGFPLEWTPTNPAWNVWTSFGTIMNRMKNLGNSFSTPSVSASDPSTALTLISGNGMNLAWFYTNSTSGDTASVLLDSGCSSCSWIAVSALDWAVVATGSGPSAPLSVRIPSSGWNPIYIFPAASNLNSLYSNLPVTQTVLGAGQASYTISGPKSFSEWLIVQSSSKPTSVTSANLGTLTEYSSL
jgi:hypothetical protein